MMLTVTYRVLKPENSLQWHKEVFEWIDRWTKPDKKHQQVDEAPRAEKMKASEIAPPVFHKVESDQAVLGGSEL